jgi:hypothetical protein
MFKPLQRQWLFHLLRHRLRPKIAATKATNKKATTKLLFKGSTNSPVIATPRIFIMANA